MAFEHVLVGDVFINRWSGSADVQDVDRAFKAAQDACARLGSPVTNIAIMAKDAKFPSIPAIQRMIRDHAKMREFHRSVHYLILAEGFVASRLISFISRDLIGGTGGSMHLAKTAKEAIEQANTYGQLKTPSEVIYKQLKLYGVPDDKLGRAA